MAGILSLLRLPRKLQSIDGGDSHINLTPTTTKTLQIGPLLGSRWSTPALVS